MPVVLFSIDGTDNSAGAFQKATSGLGSLDNAYTRASGSSASFDRAQAAMASSSSRVESAILKVQVATLRQAQLVQQATTAADRYGSVIASVATSGNDAASSQLRLSTAFDASTSAQTRAQTAALRTAESLNKLALAQDTAARNEAKLRAEMEKPIKDPVAPSGGTGGKSGGRSGGGQSYILPMLGYTAAYGAASAVSDSLTRDASYSRLLGSTAAMTGLNPAQSAALDRLTTQQAASGTQPYDRSTLLQGEYSLASLGIGKGNPATINDVETIIARGSAASGAADTSIIGDTLTTLIAAYGLNTNSVVANTQKLSDQLTVGIKLGKVDAPGFATAAGGPVANMAKTLGVSTSDVIAAIAAESVGGIATGELGNDTYALLAHSARPTRQQRTEGNALGIQYDSSFWGTHGIAGGVDIIEKAMQRQGITGAMQAPVLGALLGKQDAANAFMALQAGNVQGFAPQVAGSKGATDTAYTTSQQYAGAKLQDAEVKLATSFDNLTTAALPALALAMGKVTEGFDAAATVFGNWGKTTPNNPAGGTAGDTLGNFLTPGGAGFLNIDQARNMAATGQTNTGFFPSAGSTADHVVGWMNSWRTGGANASGTSGGISAVNPALRDTYNPPNAASTTNAYGQGSANPRLAGGPAGPNAGTPGVESIFPLRRMGSAALVQQSSAGVPYASINPLGQTAANASPGPDYTGPMGINSPGYRASASGAAAQTTARRGTRWDSDADKAWTSAPLVEPPKAVLPNNDALNRAMKDLQNTISIQQLGGNAGGTAAAQAALLAFETKNAKALKLDPSDLALLAAQNRAGGFAVNDPTTNIHPFYQKQAGLGSFEAGAGATQVRIGGVADPTTTEIRRLQAQLAAADERADGYLAEIVRLLGTKAAGVAHSASKGIFGTAP